MRSPGDYTLDELKMLLSIKEHEIKDLRLIITELAAVRDAAGKLCVVSDDYGEPVLSGQGKPVRWEMVENITNAVANLSPAARGWPSE